MKIRFIWYSLLIFATTPLFAMHYYELLKVVEKEAPAQATQELIRIFDNLGRVALRPSTKKLEELIQRGANVNATNKNGQSLLELAVDENYPEGINLLLSHGANPNGRGSMGRSALHLALLSGNLTVAKLLLEKGASPNIADRGVQQNAPLFYIFSSPPETQQALVQLLQDYGADINILNNRQQTPLDYVLRYIPNIRSVQILLDAGANPNAPNSPLNEALSRTPGPGDLREQIIRALLQAGADPNLPAQYGTYKNFTPLAYAQLVLRDQPEENRAYWQRIVGWLENPATAPRIAPKEPLTSEKYKAIFRPGSL